MTQRYPEEQYAPEVVEDYRQQSRAFLGKAREYLAADDLHQASEKGWGAAAWMAKAVAVTQGWEYKGHAQSAAVLHSSRDLTGNDSLYDLIATAYGLHRGYYTRKRFLFVNDITHNFGRMEELLDILEPLTIPDDGQGRRAGSDCLIQTEM